MKHRRYFGSLMSFIAAVLMAIFLFVNRKKKNAPDNSISNAGFSSSITTFNHQTIWLLMGLSLLLHLLFYRD